MDTPTKSPAPRRGWGATVLAIEIVLSECGPLTRSQIEEELGVGKNQVSSVLSRMKMRDKNGVKRIHICNWIDSHEGDRVYPRAVYALGDKVCKRQPKRDSAAMRKKNLALQRAKRKQNSVFNLGLTDKAVKLHT